MSTPLPTIRAAGPSSRALPLELLATVHLLFLRQVVFERVGPPTYLGPWIPDFLTDGDAYEEQ